MFDHVKFEVYAYFRHEDEPSAPQYVWSGPVADAA